MADQDHGEPITNLNAADLPHLLSPVDRDDIESTRAKLEAERANDEIALRLGRAFLQGRLDAFTANADAFDPQKVPPFPTCDECNIYAGGYQYDFEQSPHDLMEHMIQQEDKQAQERVKEVEGSMKELEDIAGQIEGGYINLELLNKKIDLRTHILMITVNNLIERINFSDMRVAMQVRANAGGGAPPEHIVDALTKLFGENVRRRPPAS